jgi:hypothetical protein
MPQTSYISDAAAHTHTHTYQSAAQCRFIRADARERANQHAPENNLISTNKELKRGEIKNGCCRLLAPPAILAFVLRSLLSLYGYLLFNFYPLLPLRGCILGAQKKKQNVRVLAHKSGEI